MVALRRLVRDARDVLLHGALHAEHPGLLAARGGRPLPALHADDHADRADRRPADGPDRAAPADRRRAARWSRSRCSCRRASTVDTGYGLLLPAFVLMGLGMALDDVADVDRRDERGRRSTKAGVALRDPVDEPHGRRHVRRRRARRALPAHRAQPARRARCRRPAAERRTSRPDRSTTWARQRRRDGRQLDPAAGRRGGATKAPSSTRCRARMRLSAAVAAAGVVIALMR